jgi:hypothetical protein
MAENLWLEIPICIHGITTQAVPTPQYHYFANLLHLVNQELVKNGKTPFIEPPVFVNWGFEASPGEDRILAEAERLVAQQALAIGDRHRKFPLINLFHPAIQSMREIFLYGVTDMFYYVSEYGKKAVRKNVFHTISREIRERKKVEKGKKISLTIFSHSAGTVIAHDMLYHLFGKESEHPLGKYLDILRGMATVGEVRIRRFYTTGSPLTLFIFRSKYLTQKVLRGEKIDPKELGLNPKAGLSNPRWVNFWNRDDIISYPLEFLYQTAGNSKVVEDCYVNISDVFPRVHDNYFKCAAIAKCIAETF